MKKAENKINPEKHSKKTPIQINSHAIVMYLILVLVLLMILSLAGQYLRVYTQYDEAWGLIPLVYMGRFLSVPTIFQVLLLLFAAIQLAVIAVIRTRQGDAYQKHWTALAFVFALLSLNEGSRVETLVLIPLRNQLKNLFPGVLIFRWYITFFVCIVVLIVFYRDFQKDLPKHTKKWILISVLLFFSGFAGNVLIYSLDKIAYPYAVLRTLTKSLEISGVIAFIHSLLNYLKTEFPVISIDIKKD